MKLKALSLAVILATTGCGDNANIPEQETEEKVMLVDAPTREAYGYYDYENEEYEEVVFEEDEDDDDRDDHESDYDDIDAGDVLLGAAVGAALANSGSGKSKVINSKTVIVHTPPRAPNTGLNGNLGAKPPVVKPKPLVVNPPAVTRVNNANQRNNNSANSNTTNKITNGNIKVTQQQARPIVKKRKKKSKR